MKRFLQKHILVVSSLIFINSVDAVEFKGYVLDKNFNPIKNQEITDFVDIKLITKEEFLEQQKNAVTFMAWIENRDIKKENGAYSLSCDECKNHSVILPNEVYGESINYQFFGEFLGQHVIADDSNEYPIDYTFIDKITGQQTLDFYDVPKVPTNNKNSIYIIYTQPTAFSGTYFKSISLKNQNPHNPTVNFEIALHDLMLNWKNKSNNHFVVEGGVIYAEVVSEKSTNHRLQYIRVSPKKQ